MSVISRIMTIGSALALGLVVCMHTPTLPPSEILRWGVPWFFFASGFWFARERARGVAFPDSLRKRVRTLLVPYFVLNLIWFPILFTFNWIGWRYCGAPRVIDGSLACVVRCLGLSPCAWPALVPTWFLRSLFVVICVVGGLRVACEKVGRCPSLLLSIVIAICSWMPYWTRTEWVPMGPFWNGFFQFGLSLTGCGWFATGMCLYAFCASFRLKSAEGEVSSSRSQTVVAFIRRQLMPVYLLHDVVIVVIGWGAKALGLWPALATTQGDVFCWFAGVAGAIALGEVLRQRTPRFSHVILGGR